MIQEARAVLTGRPARRILSRAGIVLIGLALVTGLPWALSIRQRLHRADRTVEQAQILRSLRQRILEIHDGCEKAAGLAVPPGLILKLNRPDELRAEASRMRQLLGNDSQAAAAFDRALAGLERGKTAGRAYLLGCIEAGLARSAGETGRAAQILAAAEPNRGEMNLSLDEALALIDRLEESTTEGLGETVAAARAADLIAAATAAVIGLLLWYIWDTRKRREKHLQGARLVEDMLEAYSRRLEAMNAELEQVNLLKTQILSNTSHELLTPLNGIMGSLEVVRAGACASPGEEREFIEQAYTSAERLLALIRDLLDLCRLEEGDFALQPREVEFGPLLERVLARHRAEVAARGLALFVLPPREGWPRVRADSRRLDQVLQHLLANAIKFTEAGSIRITGQVESGEDAGLRMEVADTGVGIEAEKLPRVFDLFQQADGSNTRRFGGTGLGLTLSRHLIQGMGGQIGIESEGTGRGTRVFFSLPLAAAAAPGSAGEHPGPAPGAAEAAAPEASAPSPGPGPDCTRRAA